MFKKSTKKGLIEIKDVQFQYEIYYNPIEHSRKKKTELINRYVNRIYEGKTCLGLTNEIVQETLNNNDYHVIAFVKNTKIADEASGALQYFDWCGTGTPQLWIGDLCRITNKPKPVISPVTPLLDIFSNIARSIGLGKIHLMIENSEAHILSKIYKKYGFIISNASCIIEGYIVMEKSL